MKLKHALIAVLAVVAFVCGGLYVANAAANGEAVCHRQPVTSNAEGGTMTKIVVTCKVPRIPGPTVTATVTETAVETVTATATATVTATATATVTASPTSEPTPTTSPTPTETPTQDPGGCVKPNASNTGATGTLTPYTGSSWISTPGLVIENKTITGNVVVAAPNVVIRNVRSTGAITFYPGSDGGVVDHFTGKGVAISSARRIAIEHSDLTNDGGDTFHFTSDQGVKVSDITVRGNRVHDPFAAPGAHYDGMQVRGVDRLLVECNVIDLGTYRPEWNAAIFVEQANGGNSGIRVLDNWLYGGAFNLMVSGPTVELKHNRVGGDYQWDLCYSEGSFGKPTDEEGNTLDGVPVTVCK